MKYIYLLALLVSLTVISCNKTPKSTSTVESILKGGKWHLSSGTLTMQLPNGKDTNLNYLSLIVPVCHKDDYIQFYSGVSGAIYANSVKCSAADPDSVSFNWQLINNDTSINLYNTQFFYYSVTERVLPYFFDTISHSPLVLDSVRYTGAHSVIDSIYDLTFTEIPASPTPPSTSLVDIDAASITNISQSSFTLKFAINGTYPDTVGNKRFPSTKSTIYYYSLTYTTL